MAIGIVDEFSSHSVLLENIFNVLWTIKLFHILCLNWLSQSRINTSILPSLPRPVPAPITREGGVTNALCWYSVLCEDVCWRYENMRGREMRPPSGGGSADYCYCRYLSAPACTFTRPPPPSLASKGDNEISHTTINVKKNLTNWWFV